jgi:calcium/calmodulin-dependent protein kinase (CaM kinase) II
VSDAQTKDSKAKELLDLTQRLLESIAGGDWLTYSELCDPSLSAFEPESLGSLVEGMEFHKFYFDLGGQPSHHRTTMARPHVRMLGDDAAVVSYVRLVQRVAASGTPTVSGATETRVWQRQNGRWRHVHFHRTPLA